MGEGLRLFVICCHFSQKLIKVDLRAEGEVMLTLDLLILARGTASVSIKLPCGQYTATATYMTVFGPEVLTTQFSVKVHSNSVFFSNSNILF